MHDYYYSTELKTGTIIGKEMDGDKNTEQEGGRQTLLLT
jgi:hypothetical protein